MFGRGRLLGGSSSFPRWRRRISVKVPSALLVVRGQGVMMMMKRASFVVAVPLALGMVAAVAPITSAQTDPHVGTWKLDVTKSKFTPGPAPKSETFTYEADGPNLTVLVQGV